jgi:hypothetical protein
VVEVVIVAVNCCDCDCTKESAHDVYADADVDVVVLAH